MLLVKKSFISTINDNKFYNVSINNDVKENLNNIENIIFYGPPESFKYKIALKIIEKYSSSGLRYEKKILLNLQKTDFFIKISDIHYEINIELLYYNTKYLWNEIFNYVSNIIQSSEKKFGIILLKNFEKINNDFIDIIYNYMQKSIDQTIQIRFFIITDCLSFIPKCILNICKIKYFTKLTDNNLLKLCNKNNRQFLSKNLELLQNIDNINSLTYINLSHENKTILNSHKVLCDVIISKLLNETINIIELRTLLYDILILHLNIYDCCFYILKQLIKNKNIMLNKIVSQQLSLKTLSFFKEYNNNYRPIFHLESYMLYLLKLINENK
tara:strand:- start:2570 stop:3553 length:984 start_codon:yes stop_codon:yes gene_type:complete